jgi:hypothetical protein
MVIPMSQDRRPLAELRGAVSRGDGVGVIGALGAVELGHAAQLAGEGLLVAVAQGVGEAKELAEQCIAELNERDWEGDHDLAVQLAAALGSGPPLDLRLVPVELEELSMILEGDGSSGDGRVDLITGDVWSGPAIDYAEESGEGLPDADDPDRWLDVCCEGSHEGYRDMEYFIAGLDDADEATLLSVAISGSGAFRRFRDALDRWPQDKERFFAFSEERQRGRARSWLALAGIAVIPAGLADRED